MINSYPIPDLEEEIAGDISGTSKCPVLHNVTGGERGNSLIFHTKIEEGYYECVRYRRYKSNIMRMSVRCQRHKREMYKLPCAWTGIVEFVGTDFDNRDMQLNVANWRMVECNNGVAHTCEKKIFQVFIFIKKYSKSLFS